MSHTSRTWRRDEEDGLNRTKLVLVLPFMVPAALLFGVFFLWPMAQTFESSFTNWTISMDKPFVGLSNFGELVADPVFIRTIANTSVVVVVGASMMFPLSLVLAHATFHPSRIRMIARLLVVLPIALSPVAAALVWKLSLDPTFGLLNGLLRGGPLAKLALPWLGVPITALFFVIAASVWQALGVWVILFSAALTRVPPELIDAARVDGASGWQLFRHVTGPLIVDVGRTLLLLWVAGAVSSFAFVQLMTDGGPLKSTEVIATYLAKVAFRESRFGYASAMAVLAFIGLVTVTLALRRLTRRDDVEL